MTVQMHIKRRLGWSAAALAAGELTGVTAAVLVTISPGTAAPPGTLGGHVMGAFPVDGSAEGSPATTLTPPAAFPGVGDLQFATALTHYRAGMGWDTWSHGYTGDVYATDDHELVMTLPTGTLAFYFYLQPNFKDVFEFEVTSATTSDLLDVDGNGGARYVGIYTDDPLDPLQSVTVRQTTMDSDGFAVGEMAVNVVPEPSAIASVVGLGLAGFGVWRRRPAR